MSSRWEVRMSNSRGIHYFYNVETREARWDTPPELTEAEIHQLSGAQYIRGSAPAPAPEGQIRASHLLIKHRGSRRPSSWKEDRITRSHAEAVEILQGFKKQINGDPVTFAALTAKHSDCSSHEKGGDLGSFGRGQMQKSFEDAAYALKVGEMSDIITSDSGVHIILRTA